MIKMLSTCEQRLCMHNEHVYGPTTSSAWCGNACLKEADTRGMAIQTQLLPFVDIGSNDKRATHTVAPPAASCIATLRIGGYSCDLPPANKGPGCFGQIYSERHGHPFMLLSGLLLVEWISTRLLLLLSALHLCMLGAVAAAVACICAVRRPHPHRGVASTEH